MIEPFRVREASLSFRPHNPGSRGAWRRFKETGVRGNPVWLALAIPSDEVTSYRPKLMRAGERRTPLTARCRLPAAARANYGIFRPTLTAMQRLGHPVAQGVI